MSSLSSTIPPGTDISAVSGPLFIGELFHWGLFGTLSVQIYLYYMAFPKDKLAFKIIAYSVYTMELVQTILVTNDAFHAYGSGFGNYEELTSMHLYWFSVPIMSGIVSLIGQLFFAYRIWVLSHSKSLPAIIAVMAFTSTIASFMTGIFVKEAGRITNLHQLSTKIAVGIWCGVSALCDISIAACMTYFLSHNADTSFSKTKVLVKKLMRLAIETGTLTATIALITLILVTGFPDRDYYAAVSLIIPKSYANTLLVILNSRFRTIGGRDAEEDSNIMSIDLSPHSRDSKRFSAYSGIANLDSVPKSLQAKSSFYKASDSTPLGNTAGESRPGSSGRAMIQISIQNEVVTDAADREQTEQSDYSPSTPSHTM